MKGHYMINRDGQNKSKYTWVRKVKSTLKNDSSIPITVPTILLVVKSGMMVDHKSIRMKLNGLETKLGFAGK